MDRVQTYYELLFRWNETINLTSLSDGDEAIDRLLIEPLVAVRYLPASAQQLIDLGSGGGSPAIPLALARPGLALTMVESKERKTAFLREAIRHLGLTSASVRTERYEALVEERRFRAFFDVLSVRALKVGPPILGFLKPGGSLMVFHSRSARLTSLVSDGRSVPLLGGTDSYVTVSMV